jgi:hypothetical protein
MKENGKSLIRWSYKVTDRYDNAHTTTHWHEDPHVAEAEADKLLENNFIGGKKELRRLDQVYSTETLALMAVNRVSFYNSVAPAEQ